MSAGARSLAGRTEGDQLVQSADYVGALRRGWRWILLLALVGGVIAVAVPAPKRHAVQSGPLRPAWQASVTLTRSTTPGSDSSTSPSFDPASATAALQTATVERAIAAQLHVPASDAPSIGPATALSFASVGGVPEAILTADAASEAQAVRLANAAATALVDYLNGQAAAIRTSQLATDRGELRHLQSDLSGVEASLAGLGSAASGPKGLVLRARAASLESQYSTLYGSYSALASQPAPTAGIVVAQPAAGARRLDLDHVSLIDRREVRGPLGFAAGLVIGVLLILLLALTDRRLRNRGAAEEAFGLLTLVEVPRQRLTHGPRDVVMRSAPGSAGSEAYRTLLSALVTREGSTQSAWRDETSPNQSRVPSYEMAPTGTLEDPAHPTVVPAARRSSGRHLATRALRADTSSPPNRPLVFAVVSSEDEPTREVVVANMAAAAGETGRAVLVLRPSDRPGSDAAASESNGRTSPASASLTSTMRGTALPGVRQASLASLGNARPSDQELADLLAEARSVADLVLVDAGGILTSHYSASVAGVVDGIVVVAEVGRTTRERASRAAALLDFLDAPVRGLVLTQVGSLRRASRRRYNSVLTGEGA